MSSRYSKGKKPARPENGWSELLWDANYSCYYRYRLGNNGQYEYDYNYETTDPASVPRYAPAPDTSGNVAGSQYGYAKSPDYELAGVARDFSCMSVTGKGKERDSTDYGNQSIQSNRGMEDASAIDDRNFQLARNQSLYSSTTAGGPSHSSNYYSSQQMASQPAPMNYIGPRDPSIKEEILDKDFKLHYASDFKFGKVFKILWVEPTGCNGTVITDARSNEIQFKDPKFSREPFFTKIRRFVVVKKFPGHCLCLPIMTYNNRGTVKFDTGTHAAQHAAQHAIIYTDKEIAFKGEKLGKKAIRVKPKSPRDKLDPASRINYAKVYTVEYNTKVQFVGEVHKDCQHQLLADYKSMHGFDEEPDQR